MESQEERNGKQKYVNLINFLVQGGQGVKKNTVFRVIISTQYKDTTCELLM